MARGIVDTIRDMTAPEATRGGRGGTLTMLGEAFTVEQVLDNRRLVGVAVIAPETVTEGGTKVAAKGAAVRWEVAVRLGWVPDRQPAGREDFGVLAERMVESVRAHHSPGDITTSGDIITVVAEVAGVRYSLTADLSGMPEMRTKEDFLGMLSQTGGKGGNAGRQLARAVQARIEQRWQESQG